jgi:hypothetical protein
MLDQTQTWMSGYNAGLVLRRIRNLCSGRRVACEIQVIAADTAASTEVKITPWDEIGDARLSIAVDRHVYKLASSKCRRDQAFPG